MKINISLVFALLFLTISSFSQNQPSSVQDNYSGILGIPSNPGNMADNRHKLDINLFQTFSSNYNNYIALKGHTVGWWANDAPEGTFSDPNFQDEYLFERIDGNSKSIHEYLEFMGPSALYTIDDMQAVSLMWRVRSVANVDGLGEDLARLIYNDKNVPELWGDALKNEEKLTMAHMTWAEYAVGYGRVIYDEHKHFVKVGGTFKMVQGMHAAYFQIEEFDYSMERVFPDPNNPDSAVDYLSVPPTRVNYGRSESYDPSQEDFFKYNFDSKMAPALDIGVVYEIRPDREKYKYDMDGEYDLWMNDKNKYKWKFGLSITDIGRLKFDKHPGSRDYIIDTIRWDITGFDINNMDDFDELIASVSTPAPGDERTFNMQLPTALSIQIDYNVIDNFYVNFTPYWPLNNPSDPSKVHNISTYSLTPRYENKWFGASVPFSYNAYGNTAMGLSVRLGPVTVGTTDFIPYVYGVNIFGVDGYFALKVPLLRKGKPMDRDDDKVSDKLDDCDEIPGLLAFNGCPDIDNDGIADIYDDCPSDSGLAEFKGCPDTDGDGIIDKYDECIDLPGIIAFKGCPDTDGDSLIDPIDSCPNIAGLLVFHGCPDTDGDSIIDPDDLCPLHAGPIENGGCPDTDNDGIFDYLDDCPEVYGPKDNNGCPWPDTDLDGVLDKNDRCPNNPGPIENDGCPYADTDGDSILDKDDDCPNVPGVRENNGCPAIAVEEQEILNTAFANLEFLSAKAVIRNQSHSSLDELADLMIRKSEWKLKLEGHTDNVGSEKENLILSKRRAEAVQTYLSEKGVDKSRVKVEFYGETQPIESNDTAEGRQKNRRVEMEIQFE